MILQNLFTKIAKHQLGAATTLPKPEPRNLENASTGIYGI
jgi:hypothetical protein